MTKKEAIEKGINEAKAKRIKVHKYLSNGNVSYEKAIKCIRRTGIFATITAFMWILSAIGLVHLSSMLTLSSKNPTNTSQIFFSAILYSLLPLVIGIYQLVLCYRLRNLTMPPKIIKRYLIIILLLNIIPSLLSIFSGVLALPGIFPLLAIVFSIEGLYNFAHYEDWYTNYKYPIAIAHKSTTGTSEESDNDDDDK